MSCICGNDKNYNDCCGAIIDGKKTAKTPEELMRSRYSAYVQSDVAYLLKSSLHHDDHALIEEFCKSVEWLQLTVLKSVENIVEFKAYYRENSTIKVLHEKSFFIQKEDIWLYDEGELYTTPIKRNEPCPCGSGKKYKKCCL